MKEWVNNLKFVAVILGVNTLIWGVALEYNNNTPKQYTSKWSVILPGNSSNSNINIQELGQASSSNNSAYVSGSIIDPRANFKVIATSPEVVEIAALKLNISVSDFGEPKAKLVDPTATVEFSITGSSPKEAMYKASALSNAAEIKINQLRKQDIEDRIAPIKLALIRSQADLVRKQQELINFRTNTGLVSNEQISSLVNSITNLKQEQALLESRRQQQISRLDSLSNNLQLQPKQIVFSYNLIADNILQQNLKNYTEISAQITQQNASLLPNHPIIISLESKRDFARNSLLNRASELSGRTISEQELNKLLVINSPQPGAQTSREAIYNNLITTQTDVSGLNAEASTLNTQVSILDGRLKNLSKLQPTLSGLEQQLRSAELVYNTTLSRITLDNNDIFSTYPQSQLLGQPSLPTEPSSPQTKLILIGALLSSMLITLASILLWARSGNEEENTESKFYHSKLEKSFKK